MDDSDFNICGSNNDCMDDFICGKQIENPKTNFMNLDTYLWSMIQVISFQ